jgi:hypothetical protein
MARLVLNEHPQGLFRLLQNIWLHGGKRALLRKRLRIALSMAPTRRNAVADEWIAPNASLSNFRFVAITNFR